MKRESEFKVSCEIKDVTGVLCDVYAVATVFTYNGELDYVEISNIMIEDDYGQMTFDSIGAIPQTHFHKVDIDKAEQALESDAECKLWEDIVEEKQECLESGGRWCGGRDDAC